MPTTEWGVVVKPVSPSHTTPSSSSLREETNNGRETGLVMDRKRHSSERAPGGLNHESATCVQRFDDSLIPAIHTTYRISLRSSSSREPRYPLLGVVIIFLYALICMMCCFFHPAFKHNARASCLQLRKKRAELCVLQVYVYYTHTHTHKHTHTRTRVCVYVLCVWEYFNSVCVRVERESACVCSGTGPPQTARTLPQHAPHSSVL
jgi:hypothetical protein